MNQRSFKKNNINVKINYETIKELDKTLEIKTREKKK